MTGKVSDRHEKLLDQFLSSTLDDYKNGVTSRLQATRLLKNAIIAIDNGLSDEAVDWMNNGSKEGLRNTTREKPRSLSTMNVYLMVLLAVVGVAIVINLILTARG